GHTPARTLHIDALAARGVRFLDASAADPVCSPARASLLTGRYGQRFGFDSQPMQRYPRNRLEYLGARWLVDTGAMTPRRYDAYPTAAAIARQGLPPSEITLADVLAAAGWRTGLFGKWHLGYAAANGPDRFGFQHQYGFDQAFTLYAPAGAEGIVEHRHDLFWEKHIWSMGRDGPSAITRAGAVVEEDRYLTDAITEEALAFLEASARAGAPFFAYLPFNAPHTPFQAPVEDYDAVEVARDHNQRVYLAMIRRLDHAVGRIERALVEHGLRERTLVVFTSDNGGAHYTQATDNGPLRAGKFTQFEGGVAVPLLIAGPGWAAGTERSDPVSHLDLLPTLLGQLGLAAPPELDGFDLRRAAEEPRTLYWRTDFARAIRRGDWKLLQDRRDPAGTRLYDLAGDVGERRDLAGAEPERVRALLEALDAWEASLPGAGWPRVMDWRECSGGECRDFAI
ncbi:MAG: sulfatase-like hydrolase/transferase, partial [Pseudomonadales bacterium]|nr:sulfatase-like hydrolase/transferase [Pseudomonadales bacterium]